MSTQTLKKLLFDFCFVVLAIIFIFSIFFYFNKQNSVVFSSNLPFQQVSNNNLYEDTKLTNVIDFQKVTSTTVPTINPTSTLTNKTSDYIFFPVSKTVSLDQFYPNDLYTLSTDYATRPLKVSQLIQNDLKNMIDAAKKDGVDLKVVSGFRSYDDQVYTFNYYVSQERKKHPEYSNEQAIAAANNYSAKPGHSEHQLGTTIDLGSSENGYQLIADDNMKYQQWILTNASKYHFRISYPKGNTEYIYEPWHIRWWPK